MHVPEAGRSSGVRPKGPAPIRHRYGDLSRQAAICVWAFVLLLAVAPSSAAFGQDLPDDEGYGLTSRRGLEQIDRMEEKLRHYGKICLKVGAVLAGIAIIKIIGPFQRYQGTKEKMVERAVRGVGDLVKRIEEEAQAATPEPQEETTEGSVLAGMTEIAEYAQGEEVPSYVLTVNDLTLDNIRVTLKRLRRFKEEGHAPRYRGYMFSVLKGLKTITEECLISGAPSSLAVDVEAYFRDERRYKAWNKLLSHMKREGEYQEVVDTFLLFIRNIKEGRPLVAPTTDEEAATEMAVPASPVPERLTEDTLPAIQQAALEEAKNLIALVRTGKPLDANGSWQFELVQRQQQLRLRDEAQRILKVFLSRETKALPQITKTRMLPCRTWQHVLHMLGVDSATALARRIEERLLTIQEIVVIQKAFLQTFAKRTSLQHVYGKDQGADLMIDMHTPQIRRESLGLLRRLHETEPSRFDRATNALNEEETPQHNQVTRLMEHYIHHRHQPPGIG